MKTKTLFSEIQWGLKNWVLSVVVIFIMTPVCIYLSFQMTKVAGLEQIILLCTLTFHIALCLFFIFIKLKIEVTQEEIKYQLFPFHFSTQTLSKNEIIKIENVIYNPIGEWGGWGIRRDFKGNKAYNMYGNKGVKVTLQSGKIILFGSQKPNEFYDAILKK